MLFFDKSEDGNEDAGSDYAADDYAQEACGCKAEDAENCSADYSADDSEDDIKDKAGFAFHNDSGEESA